MPTRVGVATGVDVATAVAVLVGVGVFLAFAKLACAGCAWNARNAPTRATMSTDVPIRSRGLGRDLFGL